MEGEERGEGTTAPLTHRHCRDVKQQQAVKSTACVRKCVLKTVQRTSSNMIHSQPLAIYSVSEDGISSVS